MAPLSFLKGPTVTVFFAVFLFAFVFSGLASETAHAATGTFKVSDYGTGATSGSTSQYYRGYIFRVSETVVIDKLIGGGAATTYGIGIYSTTINGGGASVTAVALLGQAVATTSGSNQILPVTNGNSGGGSTITLVPDTDYLIASGKGTGGTGNHWVVTSLNVANIIATPLIETWGPTNGGYTYRWNGDLGAPNVIVGKTSTDIQGTTLPMLGFSYETSASFPTVTTDTASSSGSQLLFKGSIDNTGNADTAMYIEWGKQSNLSDGTLESIGTLLAASTTPYTFSFAKTASSSGSYYYRAVGINVAGRINGSISGPYAAYSLQYAAGANGTLTGSTTQVVWAGKSGTAVIAVPNDGYSFLKWSDDSVQNPRTDLNVSGSVNVTAQFEEGVAYYNVSFENNGGTTSAVIPEIEAGDEIILPSAPTRSGHTFGGWTEAEDLSGMVYGAGDPYTMPAYSVTLHAIWSANPPAPIPQSNPVSSSRVSGGGSSAIYCSVIFCSPVQASLVQSNTNNAQSTAMPSAPSFTRDLQVGSNSNDVLNLQRFLNTHGYPLVAFGPGSPTNETSLFGRLTKDALARFQAANGISPASGNLGPLTRAFIANMEHATPVSPSLTPVIPPVVNPASDNDVRDLDVGMSGDDVRALQTLLISQGYAIPAGATGYFAGQTKDALSKYQAKHGVVPSIGYFGIKTRTQMKAAGLSGLWW